MKKADFLKLMLAEKDKKIIEWLVNEKKFSPTAALKCLTTFKETMKFAGLMLALLACTSICWSQYTNSHTVSLLDSATGTSYATSGTNTWKAIPNAPIAKSLIFGVGDNSLWVIGAADSCIYSYNPRTRAWTKETAMTCGNDTFIVQSAAHLYLLESSFFCRGQGNGTALYEWNGTQWVATASVPACLDKMSAGADGFLVGILGGAKSNASCSTDAGKTWASCFTGNAWNYINMLSALVGCGVDESNNVDMLSNKEGAFVLPAIPTGTAAGCLFTDPEDPTLIAWNTAGTVYLLSAAGVWQQLYGPVTGDVVGDQMSIVYGLSAAGVPYHWNWNAPKVVGNVGGAWTQGCPGPGEPCHSTTTHTGKVTARFKSGHGINGGKAVPTKTVLWNASMSGLSDSDINFQCDPFLDPYDPECFIESSSEETCNQSGSGLSGSNDSIQWGLSIDDVSWVRNDGVSAPRLYGTPDQGYWQAVVRSMVDDICYETGGVPTCPFPTETEDVFSRPYCIFFSVAESAYCLTYVNDKMYNEIDGSESPWAIFESYVIDNNAPPLCMGPTRPGVAYNGDEFVMPACQ